MGGVANVVVAVRALFVGTPRAFFFVAISCTFAYPSKSVQYLYLAAILARWCVV